MSTLSAKSNLSTFRSMNSDFQMDQHLGGVSGSGWLISTVGLTATLSWIVFWGIPLNKKEQVFPKTLWLCFSSVGLWKEHKILHTCCHQMNKWCLKYSYPSNNGPMSSMKHWQKPSQLSHFALLTLVHKVFLNIWFRNTHMQIQNTQISLLWRSSDSIIARTNIFYSLKGIPALNCIISYPSNMGVVPPGSYWLPTQY